MPSCSLHLFLVLFSAGHCFGEYSPGLTRLGVEGIGSATSDIPSKSNYVALSDIKDAFHLSGQSDPLTRVQLLRGSPGLVSICPGMRTVLINNKFYRLPIPVIQMNGATLVPLSFGKLLRKTVPVERPRHGASKPRPKSRKLYEMPLTILLDAGHGGRDPGARGQKGLQEKEVTLDVVRRLQRLLELRGHRIILTRSGDTYPTLRERVVLCQQTQPDMFISVHINASSKRRVRGIETYYSATRLSLGHASRKPSSRSPNPPLQPHAGDMDKRFSRTGTFPGGTFKTCLYDICFQDFQKEGKRLAYSIQEELVRSFPSEPDRHVKSGPWYVIRWAQAPAVLVELGFVSNPATEKLMATSAYRQELAAALLNGILRYIE